MRPKISFHRRKMDFEAKASIVIPSWNNLEFLKLCIKSIEKNSYYKHQVIIHVNEGKDGTLEWIKEKGYSYSYSTENVGVCYGMNAAAHLAETEYLFLIDDDNYMAPNWDKPIFDEVEKIGHNYFALSSTRLEPYPNKDISAITPANYGTSPETFDEESFIKEHMTYEHTDWNGSSWYPMLIHKSIWDMIGGLSIEFSPGIGSDPDFMMKLWHIGVRYFKGLETSRAYHFVSRSVSRVKKNDGKKQFPMKWGMNISTFYRFFIKMGEPFSGSIKDEEISPKAKKKQRMDKLRRKLYNI